MVKEKMVFKRITNGIERVYSYKLIKSTIGVTDVYGIEIERKDFKGDIEIDSYKDSVDIISPKENKVRQLLEMLYNNQVSPIHLIDIAGEFIDTSVSDFEGIEFKQAQII